MEQIIKVPLERIKHNPYQPESRIEIPEETAAKFGKSILEHGLLQTPVVRVAPGSEDDLEMGDGWLRFAGYKWLVANGHAEFASIPVRVAAFTDRQMADLVLEANSCRQDMTPIDRAKLFQKILADFSITQAELARAHNISQGEVANTIRLLELPAPVQDKVISQEISETHARQLLRLNQMPDLQREIMERSICQFWTVSALDREINSSLWRDTRSLQQANVSFNVKACAECPKRVMAADPWGDNKKQYRCPDTVCWNKKQDEVEAARAAKLQEKVKTSTRVKKVLVGKDLQYNQYQTLHDYELKGIDNPGQCKTCDKTALYRYSSDNIHKPELVCLNPNCFRAKKSKKTREVNKVEKQQDHELTAKIGKTIHGLADHKSIAVVLARYLLGGLNMDGEADMLAYFPDLPTMKKAPKRLDDEAVKKELLGRSLDQLLQFCAAAVLTHSRRQYSGGLHSVKLGGAAKENYAILTVAREDVKIMTTEMEAAIGSLDHAEPSASRQDLHTPPAGLIPEGVRQAHEVPDAECRDCKLDSSDHTLGHKFLVGDVSHKVCIRDYRAWEKKQRVSSPAPAVDPLADLEIRISEKEDGFHSFKLGKLDVGDTKLKGCVFLLGQHMKWGKTPEEILATLKTFPASTHRDLLIGILEGTRDAVGVEA